MIPEQFIQELLNRVDIVDVIDKSVPLKKAGANYQACCPFHNEKSPSFTVSPSKQFYHCFGCGAHGTAIGFLMEHSGLSFVEAIHELAKSVGMIVPQEKRENSMPETRMDIGLQDTLQQAAQYYKSQLKSTPRAIEYLKNRGLSGQVAAKFQIGYAPDGWQNLQSIFKNYEAEALETVGLVTKNEQGRRYDRFRDRIMFPIHNQKGVVIGFGGRVINPDDSPKYYNSPETPLFQKGHELYGLYQARRAIREVGRVLVVEGYMDVVALAQYGIEYAVAALGTATTPFHITKLMRQTDEIVFSFDGDAAGQKAAWRAVMNALPAITDGLRLKFLFLPQEHDPDSFVREFGREKFEAEVASAKTFSQYVVDYLCKENPLKSPEDRVRLMNEAESVLKPITAPRLSLQLQKMVAELANVTPEELRNSLKLNKNNRPEIQYPSGSQRGKPITPTLARKLLVLILHKPVLATQIDPDRLQKSKADDVLRKVCELVKHQPNLSAGALLQAIEGMVSSEMQAYLSAKMMDEMEESEVVLEFEGALKQLDKHWEKTESLAAELLKIAQEQGLDKLTEEQRNILRENRWGHIGKTP